MSFGVVRPSFTVSRRFLPYSKALLAHVQMTSSTPSSSSSSSRLPYSSKTPAAADQRKSDNLAGEREASSDTVSDRKQQKQYEQPLYATKAQYRARMQEQRASQTYCAETGLKPTNWQRRFLVLTKLYQSTGEIPEYIAPGTMQKMHNRMRVVFIVVACTVFYLLFFTMERSWAYIISKDQSSSKRPITRFG